MKNFQDFRWKEAKAQNKILIEWADENLGKESDEFEKHCVHCQGWKSIKELLYLKEDFRKKPS